MSRELMRRWRWRGRVGSTARGGGRRRIGGAKYADRLAAKHRGFFLAGLLHKSQIIVVPKHVDDASTIAKSTSSTPITELQRILIQCSQCTVTRRTLTCIVQIRDLLP